MCLLWLDNRDNSQMVKPIIAQTHSARRTPPDAMNRGFVAGLFALLAFLDWTIVARITLLIAAVNFVMNPDPMARMASLVMMV